MKKDKYTFISYVKEELGLVDWKFSIECIIEILPVLLIVPVEVLTFAYFAKNMPYNLPLFIQILLPFVVMVFFAFLGVYISLMICDYHDHKERHKRELKMEELRKNNESRSIDE